MAHLLLQLLQRIILFVSGLFIVSSTSWAQVAIGTSGTTPNPDPNAVLLLVGNGNQGLLLPSVTTLGAFGKPGMVVYNSSTGTLHYFSSNAWNQLGAGGGANQGLKIVGNSVSIGSGVGFTTQFSLATTAPTKTGQLLMWDSSLNSGAGGWTASSSTTPTEIGQVLKWNGTSWEAGKDDVASSITFAGDISGPSNNSTITTKAGNNIVAAMNDTNTGTKLLPAKIAAGTQNQVLVTSALNTVVWGAAPLPSLSSGKIWVGNGTNQAEAVSLSGDASITGSGLLTILSGKITSDKILDGEIVNADISAAANISDTKLATISTAGKVSGNAITTGTIGGNTNFNSTGNVSAAAVSGNGSALTNLSAANLATGTVPTARLNVGTGANQLVQLDGSGKLPAIDGSQLTNLAGGGDITGVTAGTGLNGGAVSGNATLNVDVGTSANKIVQLDGSGKLPAVDGSQLTNLPAGTETDPTVKAINGLVKSNGTTISAATAGTDYQAPLVSGTNIKTINGATVLGSGNITAVTTETDPAVKAINGLVKSNGTTISAATAGTDYLAPNGNGSALTNLSATNISSGTLAIANGGTGATTAAAARTSLGLGTLSTLNVVSTAEITDGTITNADINTSAAIDGSKINPNFGTQDITAKSASLVGVNGILTNNSSIIGVNSSTAGYNSTAGTNAGFFYSSSDGSEAKRGVYSYISGNAGQKIGVLSEVYGSNGNGFGIRSISQITGTGFNYGVFGNAVTSSSQTGYGLYGITTGSGITNYGVYGEASGASTNWAGYFQGNTAITGSLMVGATPTAGTSGQVLTSAGPGAPPTWSPAGGSGWGLTGNAGTVDGTNFIGTTDNVPLSFIVNNEKSGRIDHIKNNIFFGYRVGALNTSGVQNAASGSNAFYLNTTGSYNTAYGNAALYSNTTGAYNTAIGSGVLVLNTDGDGNTAIGSSALASNTSGFNNTANGYLTLNANTTGAGNTANGLYALFSNTTGSNNAGAGALALYSNTTGNNNIANGYLALYSNTSGTNNTAIGSQADVAAGNLTNATAIGYNAKVGASNSLVLGGTGSDAVKVGIGTTTPTERLDVTGNVKFSGALMPNNTAGTAGQVLTSAGAGAAPTWVNASTITDATDEFTASAAQTSFALTQTPSARSKVKLYINGIRISNTAYSIAGNTLTYSPANNGSYTLTAGDRIQCDYFY